MFEGLLISYILHTHSFFGFFLFLGGWMGGPLKISTNGVTCNLSRWCVANWPLDCTPDLVGGLGASGKKFIPGAWLLFCRFLWNGNWKERRNEPPNIRLQLRLFVLCFFFFSNLHKASLKSTFVVSELCKVFSRWKFSLEFSKKLRTVRHVLTELLTWAKSEITNNLSGLNPIGIAIHTVASFFESNIPRAKWIFVGTETWL
jgi:hypothetical protein